MLWKLSADDTTKTAHWKNFAVARGVFDDAGIYSHLPLMARCDKIN